MSQPRIDIRTTDIIVSELDTDLTTDQIDFVVAQLLEPNTVMNVNQIMTQMNAIDKVIKRLEKHQDTWKEIIKASMEKNGIKKVENDQLTATFIEPTEAVGLDQDKLKKEYQEVYLACVKKTQKKGYLKVAFK